jgi:predicted ABC-type ATPase
VGSFTHEESSLLAKRIAKDAGKQGYNMLLDGSGDGTVEGMIKKIAGYREGGHEIVAHYVTTDVKTAIARSDARGAQTGRYVPHTYLKYLHAEVSKVFPLLAKTGVFDKYSLIDTSGASPKVVVSGAGIKMTVHEPALYKTFKNEAKENT